MESLEPPAPPPAPPPNPPRPAPSPPEYPAADDPYGTPPRTFRDKLFDIGFFGWTKLVLLSVAVGVLLRASGFNPFEPGFSLGASLKSLGQAIADFAGWSIQHGWLPALTGALIVFPVWFLWRLASAPFRR